jgi:PKD repeat protein
MKKLLLSIAFISIVSFANAQCQAGFTYTVSNDTITLTDASTFSSPMNYQWNFYQGNCITVSYAGNTPPPIFGIYSGDYLVCLTISDTMPSTCNSTFCDSITMPIGPHPACDAFFTSMVDTAAPYPVHFYNNYCYNQQWFWDFGDGTSSTLQTPYHLYSVNGIYTVCLTTITTAGDTCTFCDTIDSTPCSQLLNVSYTHSLNGNTASFTSNCSGSSLANPYYWSFDDGTSDNSPNPTHTYLYNGTYNVCLMYMGDSMWCSETYCDTLTITNALQFPCNALFSYIPDTFSTYSIYFYDLSTMNIVSWNWSFPGGTPSTSIYPYQSVAYPAAGTYTAYLTVMNQSGVTCSYSNTVNVGSNCSNTLAYFTMSPTATPHVWNVVNLSTGAPPVSYSWNWGDGSALSTGANPTHTYAQAGWYNICLTISDANGCGSSYCTFDSLYKLYAPETVISVYVTYPAGVNDISSLDEEFSIYPNPASGRITINIPRNATIEVLNLEGQMIRTICNAKEQTTIDLTDVSSGVYIIKVRTDKEIAFKKFTKE